MTHLGSLRTVEGRLASGSASGCASERHGWRRPLLDSKCTKKKEGKDIYISMFESLKIVSYRMAA